MALTRTWYSDGNIAIAAPADGGRSIMWAIKCFLKGTLGSPTGKGLWTVEGSSDGATAGMDAVDRWTDTFVSGNMVWNTILLARSWIVMKSPVALGPIYLLLDCTGNTDASSAWHMAWASNTPFTGGTVSARPTSTGEWAVHAPAVGPARSQIWEGVNANHNHHFTMDATGNFWFTDSRTGTGRFHFLFGIQTLIETRTNDLFKVVSITAFDIANRGALGGTNLSPYTTTTEDKGRVAGRTSTNGAATLGGEMGLNMPNVYGVNMGSITTSNAIDGTHDIWPCYVCQGSALGRGVRGRLPDVALVPGSTVTDGAACGASFPQAPAAQLQMVVGNVLLPFTVPPNI